MRPRMLGRGVAHGARCQPLARGGRRSKASISAAAGANGSLAWSSHFSSGVFRLSGGEEKGPVPLRHLLGLLYAAGRARAKDSFSARLCTFSFFLFSLLGARPTPSHPSSSYSFSFLFFLLSLRPRTTPTFHSPVSVVLAFAPTTLVSSGMEMDSQHTSSTPAADRTSRARPSPPARGSAAAPSSRGPWRAGP